MRSGGKSGSSSQVKQAEQLRRLSALGDFDDAGLRGFVTTTGGSCDWDGPKGRPNNVAAAYSPRCA